MAAATAPAPQSGEVTRILDLLDAMGKLGAYATVTLFSDQFADADVLEYALRLWASANQRQLDERFEDYADGKRYRFLDLVCDGMDQARLVVHFPGEQLVDVREPAPGIVIRVPVNDLEPPEPDDSAARFALMEID
jgi:hypothetical protein